MDGSLKWQILELKYKPLKNFRRCKNGGKSKTEYTFAISNGIANSPNNHTGMQKTCFMRGLHLRKS